MVNRRAHEIIIIVILLVLLGICLAVAPLIKMEEIREYNIYQRENPLL